MRYGIGTLDLGHRLAWMNTSLELCWSRCPLDLEGLCCSVCLKSLGLMHCAPRQYKSKLCCRALHNRGVWLLALFSYLFCHSFASLGAFWHYPTTSEYQRIEQNCSMWMILCLHLTFLFFPYCQQICENVRQDEKFLSQYIFLQQLFHNPYVEISELALSAILFSSVKSFSGNDRIGSWTWTSGQTSSTGAPNPSLKVYPFSI